MATEPTPPAQAQAVSINPVIVKLHRQNAIRAVVVGAGGIGARLIPGLAKMLREGDEVHVYDGDTVEERNINRQHFCEEDIGTFKAEVMQSRYHTHRVPVIAHCHMLARNTPVPNSRRGEERTPYQYMRFGCVDSKESRRILLAWMGSAGVYIDGGNERRSGQVLLGWTAWRMTHGARSMVGSRLDISSMMPQVFAGADVDDMEGCGFRVDIQTVNVNNMAASLMLNCASMILNELPMTACGWVFSTFNSIQPIPIAGVSSGDWSGDMVVTPSTTFATR